MAIDGGITIGCTDLQASGGIKRILLRSWTAADVIAYANGAGVHSITSLTDGTSTATWYNYEFKNQLTALTVNATKENGSTSFECGVSFTIPKMDNIKFHELQNLLNEWMMVIAIDSSDTAFVVGVSEKYENESVNARSQTFANLTGMEGGSGAAYNDDNGMTVNIMAKQYELPRIFTGTILYIGPDEATTN